VARHRPEVVVHLASHRHARQGQQARLRIRRGRERHAQPAAGLRGARGAPRHRLVSSGAAYGYHADNPEWLVESDPVRGNEACSPIRCHKRLVEEMLAEYRAKATRTLEQVVFRIGTILGDDGAQPDHRPVREAEASWPSPVQRQPVRVHPRPGRGRRHRARHRLEADVGIFNVAGDGKLSIHEIAERKLGKTCRGACRHGYCCRPRCGF
jgi:UDP-glucose 4-epimerase